jgi:hypothetical protein
MRIALSGYMGSGKTTIANMIKEKSTYMVEIVPFATKLKQLAKEFGWDGQKDDKGRKFLQLLGTDVGRCYKPNYWIDTWLDCQTSASLRTDFFIADDARFPNEVAAIQAAGGIHIKVVRPGFEPGPDAHASETSLLHTPANIVLHNNSTLEGLSSKVNQLVGLLDYGFVFRDCLQLADDGVPISIE